MAWQLETVGYRTMLQAWDFVPGTNFIDFMDHGVREATVVVAVLSRSYMRSTYGRLEWQAALRADPVNPSNRLVTVRVEDCALEGLLATITYLDLVGISSPGEARTQLLSRIRQALEGRAKPPYRPGYPPGGKVLTGPAVSSDPELPTDLPTPPEGRLRGRRAPATPPAYPLAVPAVSSPRSAVTLLHVPGPRFGRGLVDAGVPVSAKDLQARIWGDVTRLTNDGAPRPDLLVVTGDLTESGSRREFDEALAFLTGLRALLALEPQRLVIVPGSHDVTRPACLAYFADCEAEDIEPQSPYWPKWRHYARLFEQLYQGVDGPVFDSGQPWTLFAVPDLQVVVAGLNSTMAESHDEDNHYGWMGEAQAAWFAQQLRPFEDTGWLRIGAVRHVPPPVGAYAGGYTGGADRLLLRDAVTLDRLLGPRLNLLVHGSGPSGREIGFLGSGLPTVPPIGPGRDQHQLLQLTSEGLTRWAGESGRGVTATGAGSADLVERLERRWLAVGGTFAPRAAEGDRDTGDAVPWSAPTPGLATVPEPEPEPDPTSLLLDRIIEVCETRYERARIRRVAGDSPHLLVSYSDDGFLRQLRVGAHVGQLGRDDVEAFIRHVHATDPDLGSELVYQGPPPPQVLRDEALRRGLRLRSFIEFQGLLDLREFMVKQTTRLSADRLYPPHLYVPQRFRELVGADQAIREDLTEELLRLVAADDGRFMLVLGDFGRGKSFALREVARRIPSELPHLIPILIELRALDKAHSVDGLVAAHLANHGEDLIDLKAFHYMLRQGRIVLLFDGFDELVTRVTYDRAADHLDTLLRAAEDKAKIVVASRTQYFRTNAQVFTALGERVGLLPYRRVLNVEDFTPAQVHTYLVNRYAGDEKAADTRLQLISRVQDLLGLSQNPRMLSFVADLDEDRLRAVAKAKHTVSAAGLYQQILETWLVHEEQRTRGIPGTPSGLGRDELWQAVTTLALRLWETTESFLKPAELKEITDMLTGLTDRRLSADQTAHAVGTGSLLMRTGEGRFGFIHGSVVEWLVANEIAKKLNQGVAAPVLLSQRPLSQLMIDFFCDLADSQVCEAWAQRVLANLTGDVTDDVTRTNALRISARLRTPTRADLRGASLKGEDLSYRELKEVDLSGADLTDARLIGTNLTRAVLRDTRMVGTRLDEANLSGADLSGADLSRARLAGTNLLDVTVTGSRWRRAALIDVTAQPTLAGAAELRGAAMPGQPVEVGFAPAAVGVPYGFEIGRLPQPAAYSRDGSMLAVGSEDGGVLICDTVSGLPLRTLEGHRGRVYAAAYGPGDALLATGASDCAVRLWDPATGRSLHVLEGHRDWVWPMVLSPDGALLAVGDRGGVVRLWDTRTGEVRHTLAGHTSYIWTTAFHPGGALLATGDRGGTVRLWDAATGEIRQTLEGHRGSVYRLAFSPDGTLLATAGHDGTVHLWDTVTGRLCHVLTGHRGHIYTLNFHPGGALLATGDTTGAVRLWDPASGRGRGVLLDHTGAVYRVGFSPEGTLLATGDSDGTVRLWDPATGRLRHELSGHKGSVWPMAFRPDGDQLATSSSDGTTRLWDPATGRCQHVLRGHGRRITSVRFNADGSTLAANGNDGTVRLWDSGTGQLRRKLTGIADRLISAVFSSAGSLLATASDDGDVYLWNTETGDYERELDVETDHVWATAFEPGGDVLATANDDDTVRLWYRTTGRRILTLTEHRGRVRSIAFSPDGRVLATGCDDRTARVWDRRSGECLLTLRGHTDRVHSVVFSPDGGLLVSASHDGTARLWDSGTGNLSHILSHQGRLWSAAFSPDGTLLATAGDDLAIRLWDPRTGRLLHMVAGHTRRVWSVDFSPDGALLASGGDDGTVRLWNVAGAADPTLRVTLLGLPEGWAAMTPDGRYKIVGDMTGQFWHVIGMCRFEPGELDPYLAEVRKVPQDAEF